MKQLLIVFLVVCSGSSLVANRVTAQELTAKPFEHPGLLHSSDELALLKQKIDAGEEPWAGRWERLDSSRHGSLRYQPNAYPEVTRGPYNIPDIGGSEFCSDSAAAYTHALQWSLTGNEAHADKSIEILNDWSSTLKKISGHDTQLLIGMMGVRFCNAAELLRHSDAKWLESDQQQFERMLREVFYAEIKDFNPSANGNWDASMIQTMLAMGVYLDDRDMFDRGVNHYLHGETNGSIENYFNEFGECQESGRDQAHTQMGLGFLSCACEIAWKQGVDLYGASNNRLALGHEYTAQFNLGQDVRYEPFISIDGRYNYPEISKDARGRFSPIYRRVVHHYRDRMGLEVPHSVEAVKNTRRRRRSYSAHMPWESLIYAGLLSADEESQLEKKER